MQSNMTLGFNFYGQQNRSGVPAYNNNGSIHTVGGIISDDNTVTAYFGRAVFTTTSAPHDFVMGKSVNTPTVFRGVLMNSYRVNENLPAHRDYLLNTQPADAIYDGDVWVALKDIEDATVGADVYSVDATGELQVASTSATKIPAKIIQIDTQCSLVLIHIAA